MDFNGRGVPKSYFHAYIWYTLASKNGYKKAEKYRDTVAKRLNTTDIAKADAIAQQWDAKYW